MPLSHTDSTVACNKFEIWLFFSYSGDYAGTQGLGLLRLHSTYRHDLKIYASDEGIVNLLIKKLLFQINHLDP